jgi:hypothetical protein
MIGKNFEDFGKLNASTVIAVSVSFLLIFILVLAFSGIIWFEQNGSDLRRIFINRIVSSACWSILVWLIIVHTIDMARYLFVTFPDFVCLLHLVLKNAILIQIVLFYDALVLVRYLSIFCLKSPLTFQNEFWFLIVNIWVVTFSILSQVVFLLLPGRQPLNYYLCTGPSEGSPEILHSNAKVNWQLVAILSSSLVLHIAANMRIKLFKMKHSRQTKQCQLSTITKYKQKSAVAVIEQVVISDCIANVCILIALVSSGAFTIYVDVMSPENSEENIFLLYFYHFIAPFLFTGTIAVLYYTRNRPLRIAIFRELKNEFFSTSDLDGIVNSS